MIKIAIPGRGNYSIKYLILDLNGTIAIDGTIIPGVKEKLGMLSQKVDIFLVTADTNNNAGVLVSELPVKLYQIKESEENDQKVKVVLKRGRNTTVSIGNGCNDVSMLKESAIGICIIGGEGASAEAVMASDLVVSTVNDALNLLLKPDRLRATLRK